MEAGADAALGARRDAGDGKSREGDEKYGEERRGEKEARKTDAYI